MGSTEPSFQFRVGRFSRAEDLHLTTLQTEVRRRAVRIKLVAVGDDALIVISKKLSRIVRCLPGRKPLTAGPVASPLHSPLQRTHYTVVVHRGQPVLPFVHPSCVASAHCVFRKYSKGASKKFNPGSERQQLAARRCIWTTD